MCQPQEVTAFLAILISSIYNLPSFFLLDESEMLVTVYI